MQRPDAPAARDPQAAGQPLAEESATTVPGSVSTDAKPRNAATLREPHAMDADEFYGEYIVIPKTDDPDGDEIVLFGVTLEEAQEIVRAVNHEREAGLGYL